MPGSGVALCVVVVVVGETTAEALVVKGARSRTGWVTALTTYGCGGAVIAWVGAGCDHGAKVATARLVAVTAAAPVVLRAASRSRDATRRPRSQGASATSPSDGR